MGEARQNASASVLPGLAALALGTLYLIALLAAERQWIIIAIMTVRPTGLIAEKTSERV